MDETRKILLMDDDDCIIKVVGLMLTSLGNEVVVSMNGSEAITMYKEALNTCKPFDVVIMDLTIPGDMGGEEAIIHLLEIDPNVKAIVTSGYSNDPVLLNFKDHGFRGYISKPYKLDELQHILNEVMNEK
jgi:two-component system, cell cycle sensor histidine kinase and response regulator CckA